MEGVFLSLADDPKSGPIDMEIALFHLGEDYEEWIHPRKRSVWNFYFGRHPGRWILYCKAHPDEEKYWSPVAQYRTVFKTTEEYLDAKRWCKTQNELDLLRTVEIESETPTNIFEDSPKQEWKYNYADCIMKVTGYDLCKN
jgi:hypothetical protein